MRQSCSLLVSREARFLWRWLWSPAVYFPSICSTCWPPPIRLVGWISFFGEGWNVVTSFGERLVMYLGGMHPFYARIRDFSNFDLASETWYVALGERFGTRDGVMYLSAWKKPVKFPKGTLVICKDVVHLAVRDQPNPTSRRECPSMINNMELSSLLSFDPSHPRRIFTDGKTWTRHLQLLFGLAQLCLVKASGRGQTVRLVKSSVKMAEASGLNIIKHGPSIHLYLGAHVVIDQVYKVTTTQWHFRSWRFITKNLPTITWRWVKLKVDALMLNSRACIYLHTLYPLTILLNEGKWIELRHWIFGIVYQ